MTPPPGSVLVTGLGPGEAARRHDPRFVAAYQRDVPLGRITVNGGHTID